MSLPELKNSVSEAEWETRVQLAACYRLSAMLGWEDLIYTHISVRVPGKPNEFLINAFGQTHDEVTASSLLKVDIEGHVLIDSPLPFNKAGFRIHSVIHAARPEVQCVLHTHTPAGVSVSVLREGLLPLSQQSLFPLASLAYHDFGGIVVDESEARKLRENLGQARALILRNHGLLTTGPTIEDTFELMYLLEFACETQLRAQATGSDLVMVKDEVREVIQAQARQVTKGKSGQLYWPAMMRKLEKHNPGWAR